MKLNPLINHFNRNLDRILSIQSSDKMTKENFKDKISLLIENLQSLIQWHSYRTQNTQK